MAPIKTESFFNKRNLSCDSSQLVREVKLKYNWLFEGKTSKLDTLAEIEPTQFYSMGVSPEKMQQIIHENKLRRRRY